MNRKMVIKGILFGAFIGLLLISVFVFSVNEPNPSWGKWWMLRPLILAPLAGALGGLALSSSFLILSEKFWVKVVIRILGILAFMFILWVGFILGLDGTLWD